jgi:D-alanine-D-alanine ligase-like ATP-grasp enzyme
MTDLSLVPEIAKYTGISFNQLVKKMILDASINR